MTLFTFRFVSFVHISDSRYTAFSNTVSFNFLRVFIAYVFSHLCLYFCRLNLLYLAIQLYTSARVIIKSCILYLTLMLCNILSKPISFKVYVQLWLTFCGSI